MVGYLYWRLGRETGVIQRLLRSNDISWGTYVDALGTHCNAHPNNFVLLPEVSLCSRHRKKKSRKRVMVNCKPE